MTEPDRGRERRRCPPVPPLLALCLALPASHGSGQTLNGVDLRGTAIPISTIAEGGPSAG